MLLLTDQADLRCRHRIGKVVDIKASQNLVTIDGHAVLVDPDPERRTIERCPNRLPGVKPCLLTLKVQEGYSELLRIEGQRVCLRNLKGLTDGTPPAKVKYYVENPGQDWVDEVL